MAERVRNLNWKEDEKLKQDLSSYVSQGLKREEILDFVKKVYEEYTWSFRTLDRRLRAFNIYYTDTQVSVEQVQDAVRRELDGPGQLLGYRAMQNKLRQEHGLNVPRDLVHNVMFDLDEEGLAARRPCRKQKNIKGHFTTKGVNWVFSLDGHDKLMGYQNNTFPLAVYGCLDTASRKLMWSKVWVSNSDPNLIAKWYLEYLYESGRMPSILRLDKGTETVVITTMHAFLRQHHGDMDPNNTILYGPSTSNQVKGMCYYIHYVWFAGYVKVAILGGLFKRFFVVYNSNFIRHGKISLSLYGDWLQPASSLLPN